MVEGGRVEGERIYLLMENFTANLLSTFYLAKQEFQSVCPKGISLATRILKNVTSLWICARRSQSSFSSLQKIPKGLHRRAVSKTWFLLLCWYILYFSIKFKMCKFQIMIVRKNKPTLFHSGCHFNLLLKVVSL